MRHVSESHNSVIIPAIRTGHCCCRADSVTLSPRPLTYTGLTSVTEGTIRGYFVPTRRMILEVTPPNLEVLSEDVSIRVGTRLGLMH